MGREGRDGRDRERTKEKRSKRDKSASNNDYDNPSNSNNNYDGRSSEKGGGGSGGNNNGGSSSSTAAAANHAIVPVVDVTTLNPILIVGEMYIKDGKKWRLGECVLSDRYLVFRITRGVSSMVQVQYRVADIVLLRVLNFAQYFDHCCFEIHIAKVPLEVKPGFPKLTKDIQSKKSVVTFRCINGDHLMEWIDALDDASDGIWLEEKMVPTRTIRLGAADPELFPSTTTVVGGPLSTMASTMHNIDSGRSGGGAGGSGSSPTTTTGVDESGSSHGGGGGKSGGRSNLDWSISNQGDIPLL